MKLTNLEKTIMIVMAVAKKPMTIDEITEASNSMEIFHLRPKPKWWQWGKFSRYWRRKYDRMSKNSKL